jgi:hypothetical protein
LRLDLAGHSAQTPGRQQSAPHTVNGRLLASRDFRRCPVCPDPFSSSRDRAQQATDAEHGADAAKRVTRSGAVQRFVAILVGADLRYVPKKPPSRCANAMRAALLDIPYPSSTLGLGFARDGHSANPQWKE